MAKKLYEVRHPETGETKEFDWQNALELHNLHGWEIVKPKVSAADEAPEEPVEEAEDETPEEESTEETETEEETSEEESTEATETEEETSEENAYTDLESMTKDELVAYAEDNHIKVDKRLGEKGLIEVIIAAKEATA